MMVSGADEKNIALNDDQCFLMYFITGAYFGPDIKGETTKKSVFQRVDEGLPPYTFSQLTHSFIKVIDLENVYYRILKNSDKSFTLLLRRFLQGQAQGGNSSYPQFPDLFPPELHPQSRFNNRIHSLVFINNPDWTLLNGNDVERFKRLCGTELLHVERDAARLQLTTCFDVTPVVSITNVSDDDDSPETETTSVVHGCMANEDEIDPSKVGPAMVFLPSRPSQKELSDIVAATKSGVALTGSAATGQVGPIVGLVDIGECEDAYLFRVSLPGVKRDDRKFSCEVDTDGMVSICGVTATGEKMVSRYSELFEMQTHNLCPPGQFSISFKLPGPVNPDQFSGNFGTDGILEGIVPKARKCN